MPCGRPIDCVGRVTLDFAPDLPEAATIQNSNVQVPSRYQPTSRYRTPGPQAQNRATCMCKNHGSNAPQHAYAARVLALLPIGLPLTAQFTTLNVMELLRICLKAAVR